MSDSFQISDGGRVYTCNVGVPEFTPPELQGRPFRGLVRTQDHDEFGLAVLLFHLLFLGRHPFAGRWLGPGEMPLARAIGESRFAYGRDRALRQMDQPPGTPPIDIYSPGLALMFERSLTAPGFRPSSAEWATALEAVESGLIDCPADPEHHQYMRGLPFCPWCRVQAVTRLQLFAGAARRLRAAPAPASPVAGAPPPLPDLARRIEALQPPAAPALLSRAMLGQMPPRPIPEDRGAWFGALGAVIGALLTSVAKNTAQSGAVMLAGSVILGLSVLYMALRGNTPDRMLQGRKAVLEDRLGRLWHDFSAATDPAGFRQRKDALRALNASGGPRPAVEAELAAIEAMGRQMQHDARILQHQIDAMLTELVQTEADIASLRRR